MKLFWILVRYSNALDLYCAQRSGNKAAANFARQKIAECDRQLDLIGVQQ